jgi:RNA polymerase sigma-70 factor (ECF subfamily)
VKQICWQDVVEEHGGLVWKIAFRLLGNEADAADCFQDVFLAAVKLAHTQRIENIPALMVRLATTRAIDRLRRRTRENRLKQGAESSLHIQEDQSPMHIAQQQELLADLRAALGQLPDAQAEAFCFKHFQNMSQKQIGRALGVSANAAGVLVHRARLRLETLLAARMDKISEVR